MKCTWVYLTPRRWICTPVGSPDADCRHNVLLLRILSRPLSPLSSILKAIYISNAFTCENFSFFFFFYQIVQLHNAVSVNSRWSWLWSLAMLSGFQELMWLFREKIIVDKNSVKFDKWKQYNWKKKKWKKWKKSLAIEFEPAIIRLCKKSQCNALAAHRLKFDELFDELFAWKFGEYYSETSESLFKLHNIGD